MVIEKGDFFMVERGAVRDEQAPATGAAIDFRRMYGFGTGTSSNMPLPLNESEVLNVEQVLKYDDSYLPFIFLAKETASPLVAAVCVAVADGQSRATGNVGKRFLFNQSNVELMPVSEMFMQVCQTARA